MIQTSGQRKFLWGVEHASRLLREANDYVGRDAYVFRAEVVSSSPHEIKFHGLAEEREALPDYWPLLAGDAIQRASFGGNSLNFIGGSPPGYPCWHGSKTEASRVSGAAAAP